MHLGVQREECWRKTLLSQLNMLLLSKKFTQMMLFSVDTLKITKNLQKTGIKKDAAEAISNALKESAEGSQHNIATKNDILLVKKDIEMLHKEMDKEFEMVRKEFEMVRQEMDARFSKQNIQIFGMLLLAVGLIKWLDHIIV
jgi:hypothetical protein